MSKTDESIEARRARTSPTAREMLGVLRHMAVTITSGPLWQVVGHLLLDSVTRETRPAEVFSGIGFYSRPKAGRDARAIVGFVGGAENPYVLATRDEDTRKEVADIDEDETAVYNTTAGVFVRNNTTVEVRTPAGTALKLPTMADYEALRTFVINQFFGAGHTHAVTGGTTTSVVPVGLGPGPGAGTAVLKAM